MKSTRLFILFSLFFMVVIFSTQCRKRYATDCEPSTFCNQEPVDSGEVHIDISYIEGGAGIPVILYKGNIEDNQILWTDTVFSNRVTFYLPNKTRYAAEAYYQVGNQLYITLDGKNLKQKTTNDCGATCYSEYSITLDLER
jgi:hypothetical protein